MSLNPDFKKIVELVKHEPKTAAEIANELQASRSYMRRVCSRLRDQGHLEVAGRDKRKSRGQPPFLYTAKKERYWVMGVMFE